MASHGIRDKVAIIGMGCTNFGEHWDKSTDDMLIESSDAALKNAGINLDDVDAFWLGTMGSGLSGLTLSRPLKIQHKPVTHVENYCATGSEAFRNACYAVASGAYDVVMAIGVEKLKDSGYSGLVVSAPADDGTKATVKQVASMDGRNRRRDPARTRFAVMTGQADNQKSALGRSSYGGRHAP